jgi:hypothetical protein
MTRTALVPLALLAFVSWIGCGPGAGGRPKTYPVTGTVMLGGQPVDSATITFQMTSGSGTAVATTDAGGKYKLSTFGGGDGAQAGDYKVTVVKMDRPAATSGGVSMDDASYTDPAAAGGGEPPPPPKNLLPAKYATAATSPLTAKVTAAPENKLDFTLEP